jgi:uncharacterized protein (TIGR02118 family)
MNALEEHVRQGVLDASAVAKEPDDVDPVLGRSVAGMTVKLVVLYTRPDDPDAFDRHYFATHMPLVAGIPGLQRTETALFAGAADSGELIYHRVTELYFADQGALGAGFGSDEGKATAADYQSIAPPGSRMFVAVLDD